MTHAKGSASEVRIEAVVTRADGRVENLGTIVYWHRSRWRRVLWRVKRRLARAWIKG
jgi:hypothetical protein